MNGYVSNLLCHFVGRSEENDDKRFDLLAKIINEQMLRANVEDPEHLSSGMDFGYKCEHFGEALQHVDCVCFCDIPNESLGIHTQKYGKFGMGFNKEFIASKGARPIIYVPKNYDIVERCEGKNESGTPKQPTAYFPYITATFNSLIPALEMYLSIRNSIDGLITFEDLRRELVRQYGEDKTNKLLTSVNVNILDDLCRNERLSYSFIFSALCFQNNMMDYVKLFDCTLSDDDPDNFYMEREWRCVKNVTFTLGDIDTIYLPSEEYKNKFAELYPQYNGNYYILN